MIHVDCGYLFHFSCVGLTKEQAETFGRWNCEQCRSVARVPSRTETPPIDLVEYIGRCLHSLRVLNRIPKEAVTPVADALQHLIREALDRGSELAWGGLLSFSYWGLGCPGESGGGDNSRFQLWLGSRLSNLWKAENFGPCKSPRERGMGSVERMKLCKEE